MPLIAETLWSSSNRQITWAPKYFVQTLLFVHNENLTLILLNIYLCYNFLSWHYKPSTSGLSINHCIWLVVFRALSRLLGIGFADMQYRMLILATFFVIIHLLDVQVSQYECGPWFQGLQYSWDKFSTFPFKVGNSVCEMKKLTSKEQGRAATHRNYVGRYSYWNLARLSSETNDFQSCLGILASHGTFELF